MRRNIVTTQPDLNPNTYIPYRLPYARDETPMSHSKQARHAIYPAMSSNLTIKLRGLALCVSLMNHVSWGRAIGGGLVGGSVRRRSSDQAMFRYVHSRLDCAGSRLDWHKPLRS